MCNNIFYVFQCSAFFGQIDVLNYVYGFTFDNSTNNTAIISTFNVCNSKGS